MPFVFRPVARQGLGPVGRAGEVEHRGFAVIVEQPRIDEKPLRRYREIMAVFQLADAGRRIIGVIVPADLTAEPRHDDAGARRAVGRLMLAAGKEFRVAREPNEPPLPRKPL